MPKSQVNTCSKPDGSNDVRNFIARRIVLLRHGGVLADERTLWGLKLIAFALGVHESTVTQIIRRWKSSGHQVPLDGRRPGTVSVNRRLLDADTLKMLTSTPELKRTSWMTLRKRVHDIANTMNIRMAPSTL